MILQVPMESVSLLAVIFGFVLVITVVGNRGKERRERLRILEEQLRAGNLDAAAQQRAITELTPRQGRAHLPPPLPAAPAPAVRPFTAGSRFVFALGWIAIFLGIALLLSGGRDEAEAGTIVAPLGFAFVTLPIALRELESDRRRRSA